MKKLSAPNNNHGFSLMEIVIAAGITLALGGLVTQSILSTHKMSQQIEKDLDFKVDALLTDKILIKDLRNIAPSLNQLSSEDDKGNHFFDYESDRSSAFYTGQKSIAREVTLGIGAKKYFIVLIKDDRRGYSVFADPVMAYNVGNSPTDVSTPATLSFVGFNNGNFLKTKNENLLDSTGLLAVDSSAYMPISTSNPSRRSAMFVGFPNEVGDITPLQFPDGIFDPGIYTHTGTKTSVGSLDEFLRNLPPLGSVGSSVRILPVKLIKYEAVCNSDKCSFYRSELNDQSGVFGRQMLMNGEAKQMKLKRNDIATSIFYVEFVKPDRKVK